MKLLAMRSWLGALTASVLLLAAGQVDGQDEKKQGQGGEILTSGTWHGTWLSLSPQSSGFYFAAELKLQVGADNAVEGQIAWALRKAPPESPLAKKVGQTAVEHVKGKYDPASRKLSLDGYKEDDPQDIIALDQYRLILADNNGVLGGITSSHGTWQGLMSLSLAKMAK